MVSPWRWKLRLGAHPMPGFYIMSTDQGVVAVVGRS
jgi:hypothetical protein